MEGLRRAMFEGRFDKDVLEPLWCFGRGLALITFAAAEWNQKWKKIQKS